MYSVQIVLCPNKIDWLWMLTELYCHLKFMLACSIYHDILSIESWIVKLYAAASEMRDSESHSSRVETVIELYKRSRGVEKRRVYYQFNHWSVFPQNFKLKEFAEQIVELPARREKSYIAIYDRLWVQNMIFLQRLATFQATKHFNNLLPIMCLSASISHMFH